MPGSAADTSTTSSDHEKEAQKEQRVAIEKLSTSDIRKNIDFDPSSQHRNDPTFYDFLRRHWQCAVPLVEHGSNETSSNTDCSFFDNVIIPYHSESSRYYHTLVHLKELLGYLDLLEQAQVVTHQEDLQCLRLAIFFHDIIYDAHHPATNEEDSAQQFLEFSHDPAAAAVAAALANSEPSSAVLPSTTSTSPSPSKPVLPLYLRNRVATWIRATQKHQLLPTISPLEDEKTASHDDHTPRLPEPFLQSLFLDLDMSVLAKEPAAYQSYAYLIRKEYEFVPRDVYCEKRAEILQSFLINTPRIFRSELLHQAFETTARDNVKDEIELLQSGVIPGE